MLLSKRKKQIHNAKDIAEIMQLILSKEEENDQGKEHFWVIGVNTKNIIQYIELVSLGIISKTLVHPRETFRFAILKNVYGIFCIHNHPYGEVEPSKADMEITTQLQAAGDIIGIKLIDHVIISNKSTEFKSLLSSGVLHNEGKP